MASNPYKNKVIYNGNTLLDLTGDTVTPERLLATYTAHDASGQPITGTIADGDLVSYGTEEKIPSSYQRVEYLISPGPGAHMYTGVPGDDITLEIDMCYEVGSWAAYKGFWGNYRGEAYNCWRLIFASSQNGTMSAAMNTKASSSRSVVIGNTFDAIDNKKLYVHATYQNLSLTVDGVTYTANPTTSGTENNRTITIGRTSSSATDATVDSKGSKWYYVKFRSAGQLVRWYVPCYRKSDDVVGFYDMVNDTFNTSFGQVAFSLE